MNYNNDNKNDDYILTVLDLTQQDGNDDSNNNKTRLNKKYNRDNNSNDDNNIDSKHNNDYKLDSFAVCNLSTFHRHTTQRCEGTYLVLNDSFIFICVSIVAVD